MKKITLLIFAVAMIILFIHIMNIKQINTEIEQKEDYYFKKFEEAQNTYIRCNSLFLRESKKLNTNLDSLDYWDSLANFYGHKSSNYLDSFAHYSNY